MLFLDSTGLSDPFVQITIGNRSACTESVKQTNNPKWETTLVIKEIHLYGSFENISLNPPEIIVEIFDEDLIGVCKFEFINSILFI
jgi:hypothetical protein